MEEESVQTITPIPPVKKSKTPLLLLLLIIGLVVIFLLFFITYVITFLNANKPVFEKDLVILPQTSSSSSSISEDVTNVKLLDKFQYKLSNYDDLVLKYGKEKIEKNGYYIYKPKNVTTDFTLGSFEKYIKLDTPIKYMHVDKVKHSNDNFKFEANYHNDGFFTGCCTFGLDIDISTGTITLGKDYLTDKEPFIQVIKSPKLPAQYIVLFYMPGNLYDKETKVKDTEYTSTEINDTVLIRVISDINELNKGSVHFIDSFRQGDDTKTGYDKEYVLDDKVLTWNDEGGTLEIKINNADGLEQLAYSLALGVYEESKITENK